MINDILGKCTFCNGDVIINKNNDHNIYHNIKYGYYGKCNKCSRETISFVSKDELINHFNEIKNYRGNN